MFLNFIAFSAIMSDLETVVSSEHKESFRSKLARKILTYTLPIMLSVIPLFSGCENQEHKRQLEQIQAESYPLWHHTDLELNKYKGAALVYNHTLNMEPKYYDGSMPLEYKGTETPGRGYTYGSSIMLRHTFNDFSNFFIYNQTRILTGVVAVNNLNSLVAEARLNYFVDTSQGFNQQGVEIEEFHYGRDGKLIFNCKSIIDPNDGTKQSERDIIGNKERDYFFLLPFGISN